tara:strand:+ start:162 stop:263 length:102 start_codon:yes stop_codon:yes gene_type:complete
VEEELVVVELAVELEDLENQETLIMHPLGLQVL